MTPIVSFVAGSNTGKTTLLEKLIPLLKRRGLRIAVIKHDAHEFDVDYPGKDSWRFTRAGADVTVVASATHAAVMENRPVPAEELAEEIRNVDLILTEGYKHGPWPKIGLCRAGKPLPIPEADCMAVVSDQEGEGTVPRFTFEETEKLAEFLCAWLTERQRSEL